MLKETFEILPMDLTIDIFVKRNFVFLLSNNFNFLTEIFSIHCCNSAKLFTESAYRQLFKYLSRKNYNIFRSTDFGKYSTRQTRPFNFATYVAMIPI